MQGLQSLKSSAISFLNAKLCCTIYLRPDAPNHYVKCHGMHDKVHVQALLLRHDAYTATCVCCL